MGTAAEMAAVQLDNLPGQVTILQSAFDGFKTAVYEKIKAPLQELATTGADVFSQLTAAVNEGGIMGAFEALGGIISGVIGPKFAELTERILPGVSEGFAGIGDALRPFADAVTGTFSEALPVVTGAVQGFLDVFRGADVSGVIEAIAAGAKDLLSAFAGAAADVVEGVSAAVGSFMDAFDNDTVSGIISSIASGAKNLFGAFMGARRI
jgi:phage-related protein